MVQKSKQALKSWSRKKGKGDRGEREGEMNREEDKDGCKEDMKKCFRIGAS